MALLCLPRRASGEIERSDGLEQLTGVRLAEWAALGAVAIGIALILRAAWSRSGTGLPTGSVIGIACGIALVLIVGVRDLAHLARLPGAILASPIAAFVAVATIAAALAVVDFAYLRGLPLVARLFGGRPPEVPVRREAAVAALSLGLAVVTIAGTVWLDRAAGSAAGTLNAGPGTSGAFAHVSVFDLPGQAMAIAMRGARDGYVSLDSGQVLEFTLPSTDDATVQFKTVLDGLDHPRGIAFREGRLYVVERGPLPCPANIELCGANNVNPSSGPDGEVRILTVGRAQVRAFDRALDGTLGAGEVIISGLPVVDALHAPNAITLGPDGFLYLAVGNVDKLFSAPERAAGITPHPEWLGTILRFDGSGAVPEVFAKGLRNVYQVAFDDQGRMWAIDNDGPAIDGQRAEELLQIKQGRNYGFPFEGTFGPKTVRDDFALWISHHKGNAGVAWAGAVGLGQGLLAGSEGALSIVLSGDVGELRPETYPEFFEQDMLGAPGTITTIEVVSNDEIVASLYGGGAVSGALYLIRVR